MEWFEPRPPKIAAMQIQFTQSAGDLVEKLREMPIRKVTVEYSANDDPYAVLVKAHAASDPLRIWQGSHGRWLVATPTENPDTGGTRWTLDLLDEDTFHAKYQPHTDRLVDMHGCPVNAPDPQLHR